jgi:hypothetical protein
MLLKIIKKNCPNLTFLVIFNDIHGNGIWQNSIKMMFSAQKILPKICTKISAEMLVKESNIFFTIQHLFWRQKCWRNRPLLCFIQFNHYFDQGTLTGREGTVQLTSSLIKLIFSICKYSLQCQKQRLLTR